MAAFMAGRFVWEAMALDRLVCLLENPGLFRYAGRPGRRRPLRPPGRPGPLFRSPSRLGSHLVDDRADGSDVSAISSTDAEPSVTLAAWVSTSRSRSPIRPAMRSMVSEESSTASDWRCVLFVTPDPLQDAPDGPGGAVRTFHEPSSDRWQRRSWASPTFFRASRKV
ncbi:MAG: hypothetical protein MZV70_69425 [Desulfobacterales bacterium]|nr:hypothetical protein [Desulfobacterales bacterium]